MTRSLCPLLAALLLLSGCNSDTSLRVAPPPDAPEEAGGPGTPGGPLGGGWPGLPPLPSGPWGELDPGAMPDIYFVAAYGDPGCCWDCDGMMTGDGETVDTDADGPQDNDSDEIQDDAAWECQVDYAIVDLFGQVVAEFELPSDDDTNGYSWWSHIRVVPSGPGRFLATAYGWSTPEVPTQDEQDVPPNDGPQTDPEPGVWLPWAAWEIDAVAETVAPVAWQDPVTREIVISTTGRRVDIGPAWAGVEVAVLPDDPDRLLLWGKEYDCASALRPLRAVSRTDRAVLDRLWYPDDFLPAELQGLEVPFKAFALEASIGDDGRASFLLGLSDLGCGGGFAPVGALVNWSPTEGVRWFEQTPWTGWNERVSFAGWGGGGALHVESPYEPTSWRVYRGEESVEGMVSGMSWGVRPGPMLDPAGPSFALLGTPTNATESGDVIQFVHAGQTVWTIESLRFGLQDRKVTIFDLVVLPPWE